MHFVYCCCGANAALDHIDYACITTLTAQDATSAQLRQLQTLLRLLLLGVSHCLEAAFAGAAPIYKLVEYRELVTDIGLWLVLQGLLWGHL